VPGVWFRVATEFRFKFAATVLFKVALKKFLVTLAAPLGPKRTSDALLKAGWWLRHSNWRQQNTDGDWQRNSERYVYDRRYSLYSEILDKEGLNDSPIDYLEFGVWQGDSINWWLGHVLNPGSQFVGFDCFTGLPEDWGGHPAGTFDVGGKPPEVNDSRCSFQVGLFQETVPRFMKSFHPAARKVIHMDADIFTSTLYVLMSIAPALRPGDVIFFDDFADPTNEFHAFDEFASCVQLQYKLLGMVNNFTQVCIKVVSAQGSFAPDS
jgi:O-methyltransferase